MYSIPSSFNLLSIKDIVFNLGGKFWAIYERASSSIFALFS